MNILFDKYFSNDLVDLTLKCLLYGVIGLILGLTINFITEKTINNFRLPKMLKAFMQITLCAILLSFIQFYISKDFSEQWQSTTPGLFFVSVFFTVQFIAFSAIQSYANTL